MNFPTLLQEASFSAPRPKLHDLYLIVCQHLHNINKLLYIRLYPLVSPAPLPQPHAGSFYQCLFFLIPPRSYLSGANSGKSVGDVWKKICPWNSWESTDFPEGRRPEENPDDPRELPWANFSDNLWGLSLRRTRFSTLVFHHYWKWHMIVPDWYNRILD